MKDFLPLHCSTTANQGWALCKVVQILFFVIRDEKYEAAPLTSNVAKTQTKAIFENEKWTLVQIG